MKKAYLLTYNAVCAVGWTYLFVATAAQLMSGAAAGEVYRSLGPTLMGLQTLMLLELLHSILGLVPSPLLPVIIQVFFGRCGVIWGHTYWVRECQEHWSLYALILAWSITEVVRYPFYLASLLGTVPYPLFWLRYSIFVLYPIGIMAEVLQALTGMEAHWKVANPFFYRYQLLILIAYIPFAPWLVANMWFNRKRSFKKRNAPKIEPNGVLWPVTAAGDRSSTSTARNILAAAAAKGPGGQEAAQKIQKEKKWRFAYNKHLREHVQQSLQSPEGCLSMARAGLAAAQESMQFARPGQPEMSMKAAMAKTWEQKFDSAELCGGAPAPQKRELVITYAGAVGRPYYKFKRGNELGGLDLRRQLDAWLEYGTLEPDVADALKTVQLNQDQWLDLSDTVFVLLGAASAMGPLHFLLKLGATVVLVARPRALKGILQQVKHLPGKVIFPVAKGTDWQALSKSSDLDGLAKVGGCDLLTETPEIAAWLATVAPGKQLVVGNYTYLDGAAHVQISVACDCIMEHLCKARKDTAVAFLGTPTDAHVVTKEAAEAASSAYRSAAPWMKLWEALGVLKPNKMITSGDLQFIDAVLVDQGPNYILAKRMQHWRAMVARADGHIASSSVSPSTATASVTSNASFAAAYGGMHIFKPLEVAFPELSMTMMGALLIHDLRNPKSAANPKTELKHPLCLFQATSFHGGIYRCPYALASTGIPCALKYYCTVYWMQMWLVCGALITAMQYLFVGKVPSTVSKLLAMLEMVILRPLGAVTAAGSNTAL